MTYQSPNAAIIAWRNSSIGSAGSASSAGSTVPVASTCSGVSATSTSGVSTGSAAGAAVSDSADTPKGVFSWSFDGDSLTVTASCRCGAGVTLAGRSERPGLAEDLENGLGEGDVEHAGDQHHHRDEEDDDRRVGDQLAPRRPDDLAQLGDHLPEEEA